MRATISLAVLALGLGAPVALAQDAADPEVVQRLGESGLDGARVLTGVEIARVTGEDGKSFFVLSGLSSRMGGTPAGTTADPPTADTEIPETDLTAQVQAGQIGPSLEEKLAQAGIADYVILDSARVAEITIGEGEAETLHAILGIDEGPAPE